MSSHINYTEERAALEALMASGIFQRAPNMARILSYVCEKYFEGEQSHLKEYTIAVEALGRPADFDHERDSIVRVEAYRLRKRLVDFYAGEGAKHPVRIELPVGQYVPQFVRNETVSRGIEEERGLEEEAAGGSAGEVASEGTGEMRGLDAGTGWRWQAGWLGLAVIAIVIIGGIVMASVWRGRAAGRVMGPVVVVEPPPGEDVRILAGRTSGSYTDPFGRVWQPDRYASGGYVMNYAGHLVEGASDARIYEASREGDFGYDIPLPPGSYEMRLHFAEMLFGGRNVGAGGEGSRVFDVDVNGKRLLSRFDIISDAAGANIADERVFRDISPGSDGLLHLRFTHMIRDPLLNALEVRPSVAGKIRPLRIVAGEHSLTDGAGTHWEADRYHRGGQLIPRPHPVSGTTRPELFRHARCGNISYVIPVAPGSRYTVVLHFAEGWVGTGNPIGGGVGSRLFNIICNEQLLARNFDIFKEAGGAERAIERRFRGLQPNPQGKLVLHFQPVESYACINAIEVIDEGR